MFYECILCSAKSGRKDNIRRHVRNLHSESDERLRQILEKIFDNFEKKKIETAAKAIVVRDEKTEKSNVAMNYEKPVGTCTQELAHAVNSVGEPIKLMDCAVKNIATSVIKFAGRSEDVKPQDVQLGIMSVKSTAKQTGTYSYGKLHSDEFDEEQPILNANEPDSIAEIGVNLPSLEPLNFEPFPDIAPLPFINTNTNTNLTVYRQLLSPYLKKQTDSSGEKLNSVPAASITSTKTNFSHNSAATMIIDRPPKKMIEKYEIYR